MTYGSTDELGFEAAENKVHLHDLHDPAPDGIGSETYFHQGRDENLTDVHGKVIRDILT